MPLKEKFRPEVRYKLLRERRIELGWSQDDVAKKVNTTQQQIDRIERGQFKRVPSALVPMVNVLGLKLSEIAPSLGVVEPPTVETEAEFPAESRNVLGRGIAELPVYAAAEGGEGCIVVSTDPIDWVTRPAPLASVRDAYSFLVTGDSMVPRYWPGDIAMVNPHLPPRRESGVVLYGGPLEGEVRATVKEFVRATQTHWIVKCYQPDERELRLSRKEWPICHVIIGSYSRR